MNLAKPPLRILIVEDEADFRDPLCNILNLEGFSADGVGSIAGYEAWRSTHTCDALIVDRRLPDGDGLEVVRLNRQLKNVPVIVLTALGQVWDRIAGIEADVDHYLVKPVVTEELLAILRQLQRRTGQTAQQAWRVDALAWRLHTPEGAEIALTRRELVFLSLFVEKTGEPVARNDIVAALGENPSLYDPRRLEIMVRRLRHKAEETSTLDFPLATVYGVGYVFNGRLSRM